MKLICIFLGATLAVAAAKPYGVKGGYDRDNDRLVQTHIPVNDNYNADRQELSQSRKIGRPAYGGPTVVEPIGGGYRDREEIIQGRPIGSIHGDHGRITEVGRPIGGSYGQISEVGRPIGGGYGGINEARPIGGHDHGSVIVARPIGGGHDHGSVIVAKPIGGGHGHDHGSLVVARPIHNSHLETEELGHGIHQAQPIGGIKGGYQRRTGY